MSATISQHDHPITLDDLLAGEVQLASPSPIYYELNKIIHDPSKDLNDACPIIESDPALALRLLKIVNSPLYGLSTHIASIKHAIALIGLKELQILILGTQVIERFGHLPGGTLSLRDFWRTSLRCALIARALGESHYPPPSADVAFICGLLHEVGLLVLYRRLPEWARRAALHSNAQLPLYKSEQRLLGFDHYQIGAELARRWKLPEAIVVSLAAQEAPEEAGVFRPLVQLIKFAAQLARWQEDPENTPWPEETAIPVPKPLLEGLLQQVENDFEAICQLFLHG